MGNHRIPSRSTGSDFNDCFHAFVKMASLSDLQRFKEEIPMENICWVCGAGECNILGQFALVSMVFVVHLFTNMKKATCKFDCSFLLLDCILHINLSLVQFPLHP